MGANILPLEKSQNRELILKTEIQRASPLPMAAKMTNALVVHKTQLPRFHDTFRAAQYVRMSTDHQRYSIANQAATIAAYAASRNLSIVRTYADEAQSGLKIENRAALIELIEDVQSGKADFSHILVYDVSRWGRFQDTDESAHYEFICKKAGVKVAYCAELFDNDGSLMSSIMKNLKRVMAAEYSRELSTKVFAGACRLSSLGFRQGGQPGYGLRRELIADTGQTKGSMERGQRKSLQSDRVLLRPGPSHELAIVRRIFEEFVHERRSEERIARQLNKDGIANLHGRPWTNWMVHYLLENENYIGNLVYNRRSNKLRQSPKHNPPDCWIRSHAAFESIVDPDLFAKAQKRMQTRYVSISNEDMLKGLRIRLKKSGRLSKDIIDAAEELPCATLYQLRFGSLRNAYRLIGYQSTRDCAYVDSREERSELLIGLASDISAKVEALGGQVVFDKKRALLILNGTLNVSLRVARAWKTAGEAPIWTIYRRAFLPEGLILAIRLNEQNELPLDYFVFPTLEMRELRIRFSEANRARLHRHRLATAEEACSAIVKAAMTSRAFQAKTGQARGHRRVVRSKTKIVHARHQSSEGTRRHR
ncbi:recombinase family protein [Bradyrhizobium yuanmingense]|uniref:recombinase family protein n=1 Tax=Bradyrhizobium yuanmingense TaxID=108015 RepID=UPI0023B9F279|nr:recombinase family protein [Bradyrhizobium yuanmingense]MDF0520640.1 recombinase family protein [Bradyrhizobium yuanmingense]